MLQGQTGQYNTVQYNTITHVTQNNTQHSTLCTQNYKKAQEHKIYSAKTQKGVEAKVDESVLKTTRYTKQ